MPSPPPRSVLVVFHEAPLGGATLSVLRLVPQLEAYGWRFTFWVPRPGPLWDHLREQGAEVHGAARTVSFSLRALRLPPGPRRRVAGMGPWFSGLWRLIRDVRPDVVHANTLFCLPEAALARAAGSRTLLHVHEMAGSTVKRRASRPFVHAVPHAVAAVSRASAEQLAWRRHAPRIVYESAPLPEEAAPVREDPRPFVVGTVGVIARRKGTDLFVDAAERVMRATDRVRFRIIGAPTDALDAGWARAVLERARAMGIEHMARADTLRELRGWDCFVLPSRMDPFPIVVLEAMASGLPVVGTRRDGIEEQLDGGCGVLVPPEDPQALADAILGVVAMPAEQRRALGEAARARVRERFTLAHSAASLERLYRSLVGEERAGA